MGAPAPGDYVAIRQLVERFSDAVNRVDGGAWAATWAPEGAWTYDRLYTGKTDVLAAWQRAMAGIRHVIQLPYSGVIDDVTGDEARGRWYLGAYLVPADGTRLVQSLRYDDSYVRIDGEWLFKRRVLSRLYRGPADLSGMWLRDVRSET